MSCSRKLGLGPRSLGLVGCAAESELPQDAGSDGRLPIPDWEDSEKMVLERPRWVTMEYGELRFSVMNRMRSRQSKSG